MAVHEQHRAHVTAWWCEVFGGPAVYSEELGGYERMVAHHVDLDISADQRFRFASLVSKAADDAALPDDPEFRAAFRGTSSGAPAWRCRTHVLGPTW